MGKRGVKASGGGELAVPHPLPELGLALFFVAAGGPLVPEDVGVAVAEGVFERW